MLDHVLEYINTGRTLVLVGAGVSAEVGVPDWKKFVESILATCDRLSQAELKDLGALVEKGAYGQVLGAVKRQLGEERFYAECRRMLADTGKRGRVADFIVRFPFAAIFTTNVDTVLERHARQANRELSVFLNRQEDFEQLNVDLLPSLVKLHGDLGTPSSVILTDADYDRVIQAREFEPYRRHVASYFMNRQFLLVGYSANDPDVRQFLRAASGQGRRKGAPVFAILANCSDQRSADLYREYNVQVVRYRSDGRHEGLVRMFEALEPFISEKPKWAEPKEDLQRSQAMYLWSRFAFAPAHGPVQIDAIKSLLLSVLSDRAVSRTELGEAASQVVGLHSAALGSCVDAAVRDLSVGGYVTVSPSDVVSLTLTGNEIVTTGDGQGRRLRAAFLGQAKLDLEAILPNVDNVVRASVVSLVEEALVEVLRERGVEVVRSAFGQAAFTSEGSVGLFSTLDRAAASLDTDDVRYSFIKYMVEVLTHPSPSQRAYLEHLALSFVSLEALAMDPDGQRFRREYLSGRGLLIDSNVLIELLPPSGHAAGIVGETLDQARRVGIPLFTTKGVVEEVYHHGAWAENLVRTHGEESVQVLQAALGRGYGENEFLEGFVTFSVDQRSLSFPAYLSQAVGGGDFSVEGIGQFLKEKCDITLLDFSTLAVGHPELYEERDVNQAYSRQSADARNIDKRDSRTRTEAEAYTIISNWPKLRGIVSSTTTASDVGFLSGGFFLNRMAHEGPTRIGHAVCVRRDALFALCARAGRTAPKPQSFRELLVSPLFDSSAHFVDRRKYEEFFSPLIRRVERLYSDELPRFRKELTGTLLPDTFADIDPLERPVVLEGLHQQLARQLEARAREQEAERSRVAAVDAENLRLKGELEKAAKVARDREKDERTRQAVRTREARREAKRLEGRRRKDKSRKEKGGRRK